MLAHCPRASLSILGEIERGYSLQFTLRLYFMAVIHSLVSGESFHILRVEVQSLLEKGVVDRVPTELNESAIYSRNFLFPKKDGSLRPILDLRCLYCTLMR